MRSNWGSPPHPGGEIHGSEVGHITEIREIGRKVRGWRTGLRSTEETEAAKLRKREGACWNETLSSNKGGAMVRTGAIKKAQDLRRKIYVAAKSDKQKRFWGNPRDEAVMAGRNGVVKWYMKTGDYIMITGFDTTSRK